jgi:hypothetical protein
MFDVYRILYFTAPEVPTIDCYDNSTGKHVGKLIFNDGVLPSNGVSETDVLYLHYKLSQFNDVINILREEKPLFLRRIPHVRGKAAGPVLGWGDRICASHYCGVVRTGALNFQRRLRSVCEQTRRLTPPPAVALVPGKLT